MKYIVWDWNGTLLDDVSTCVRVMNGMLARRGISRLELEHYREIFTFPVREYYCAAGLDLEKEPFEALAVEYITEYNRQALRCGLYPGVVEVLEELQADGFSQIIASASEQSALVEQVENCGVGKYFQAILGVGDVLGVTKEGLAREYLREQSVLLQTVLFVGDTVHDWEVAHAMGCNCVLIANGHQSCGRLEKTNADVLDDIRRLPGYLRNGGKPI